MGNSLDKVDDGLYICSVEGLQDIDRLRRHGITHILNAASEKLYVSRKLKELPVLFTVKALECGDSEQCDLRAHFNDASDFIEQGRRQGGIVVHCAVGISRSSTCILAYLMIKSHLSLDAAFSQVHSARNKVHPNRGFWQQLRGAEAVLREQGVPLQPLALEMQRCVEEAALSACKQSSERQIVDETNFGSVLSQLDMSIGHVQLFNTHFLAARVEPEQGIDCRDLAEHLGSSDFPGIVWQSLCPQGGFLCVRAKVVSSVDSSSFRALLERTAGVRTVDCE